MLEGTICSRVFSMTLAARRVVCATVVVFVSSIVISATFAVGTSYAVELQEFSGESRYETAALQVETAFPNGVTSGYAVLVSGSDSAMPDALASSSLAGALDAPVLITDGTSLSDETANIISSMGIQNVIIVGGTSAVSNDVVSQVQALGVETERLWGDNRQDTQAAVYAYGKDKGYWGSMVFVASGSSFADALSVSSVAYSQSIPIFLAGSDGSFTSNQIDELYDGDVMEAIILGGDSAVPATMDGFMKAVTRINSFEETGVGVMNASRLYGDSRYETSLGIAEWAVNRGYATWDNVAFASGDSYADALSGSALQGSDGSVTLLVNNASCSTVSGIATHAESVTTAVRIFGGTAVVDDDTRQAICDAVGATYGYAIMGNTTVTVAQMVTMFNASGHVYPSDSLSLGGAATIQEFCQIVYDEAGAEGVKAEVVFAQAMVETGWLQFGGDVSITQFNFSGLGATGNGEPGNSFPDVQTGIRAQVQHLKAYASTDDLNQDCVDVRFGYVTRGCAPTVQDLAGTWAANKSTYASSILNVIYQMKLY